MEKKSLIGADYLLLLLYLNDRAPILGAIRLEKMMFLLTKEITKALENIGLGSEKLPDFFAYHYGPFAKDVYEQVELFKAIGFVKETNIYANEEMSEVDDWEEAPYVDELWNEEISNQGKAEEIILDNRYERNIDNKYMKYELTDTGAQYVEEKILPISELQNQILSNFKSKICSLSPKEILQYVYTKYPQYTTKSLIKKDVLGHDE